MKTKPFLTVAIFLVLIISCATQEQEVLLFSDDYSQLPRGPLGSNVGAHTEYHYLHEAKPKGNWAISTFRHNLSESWFVRAVNGQKVLFQKATNPNDHWHPMIVAGDQLWENYSIQTSFCTLDKKKQAGVAFRYRNDRCYYVLGVKENTAFLKLVKHATGFQKPYEKILASEKFEYNADEILSVRISVDMNQINAGFEKGLKNTKGDFNYVSQ